MNHRKLTSRLAEIRAEAEAILQTAKSNPDGNLTESQATAFDELMAERKCVQSDLDRMDELDEMSQPMPRRVRPGQPGTRSAVTDRNRRVRLLSPETGLPIEGLEYGERVGDGQGGVGEVASAIIKGDLSSLSNELKAGLTTSGEGGGHYLLAPEISGRVIDLARSASVVMRAGAVTVPMSTSELTLLRVQTDPTVSARRETQAAAVSRPTFGQYRLRAKTYAAIVPVTMEMMEDSANASQLIEDTLTAALGHAVDKAMLVGEGGAEILGITNSDGVNSIASVGTPTNYDEISDAAGDIFDANFDGEASELAWIHNPRDARTYDKLVDTTNQPLQPTPWARDVMRLRTTSLEAVSGATEMVVGRFSELLVGMRTTGVVMDVLEAGSLADDEGNTINAVTDFQMFIRARIRLDALMMRPSWFTVLRGVTNS